jgi:hypothetical protein
MAVVQNYARMTVNMAGEYALQEQEFFTIIPSPMFCQAVIVGY